MRSGEVLLGRYRIEQPLGRGGFGAVFRATQLPLNRSVAVKLIATSSADAGARFQQEAALAQRLEHPNTVRIIDFGFLPDGAPFIVWEFLRGQTLGELLAQGPLPLGVVERVGVQVLKSLMEAHALGIVHRDIKPANIFVTSHPGEPYFVKVLDFGIAKDLRALSKGNTQRIDLSALGASASASGAETRESQLVGTPKYMAPEQVSGEQVGPPTDLYAVGLVLAEMITGRPVFAHLDGFELLLEQGSDKPVPLAPEVLASPLGPIIQRATAKSPALRFQSAAEMLAELDRGSPTTAGGSVRPLDAGARLTPGEVAAAYAPTQHTPQGRRPDPRELDATVAAPTPPDATDRRLGMSGADNTRATAPRPATGQRARGVAFAIALGLVGAAFAVAFGLAAYNRLHHKDTRDAGSKRQRADTSAAAPDESTPARTWSAPPVVDLFAVNEQPKKDYQGKKVEVFSEALLLQKLGQAGYEARVVQTVDQTGFLMVTLDLHKRPCGGTVIYYEYASPSVATHTRDILLTDGKSIVVADENRILQIALQRIGHDAGDPACSNPVAELLLR
ncbi:MAG: protein kinase [Polyangiaceae bacterium]